MEVGVEVWIRDTHGNQSWIPAFVQNKEILLDGKQTVTVRDEDGNDVKFSLDDENQDVDNLKLRNDASESDVENLINLPYLHEPAILFCLQQRYSKSDIYTYTGPILIAMNPFKRVPLYTNQILEVYYNSGLLKSQGIEGGSPLAPHVYAIADSAYREMMKVIMHGYGSAGASSKGASAVPLPANHSILISGESGAGKTESTKIVLRYLTIVGNASGGLETLVGSVMDKVLQSNPILEAFGNAKTLRNDNSSRFGKFIELNFNKRGHLIGSRIKTYLLEKVRLPSQQRGERNFHIFYQLVSGATQEERNRWGLLSAEEFLYTAQGGVFTLRDMDDAEGFAELRQGLATLSFRTEDQCSLLDIVAGLLHLGQIEFQALFDAEGEGSTVSDSADCQRSLNTIAALCGLSVPSLVRTLTVRTIVAREESYEKKLTAVQASDARDALAKAIYGRLFDWIVYTINLSIQVDPKLVRANIGVLDIFGFECFVNNSFEQLCINYTNETLQQQFNQYIFKMEQIEYRNEKIEWSFIEFPDNQDCLDLIEHKLTGIFAMIDDECRLPKATDEKLASRMYKALETHSRFSASAPQKRDHKFCIKHYAGNVVYSAITFVEKNKDELPREASALLQGSAVPLLVELFTGFGGPLTAASGQDKLSYSPSHEPQSRRPSQLPVKPVKASGAIASLNSVATQFKGQLVDLMDSIRSTTPHYIRCLKPNDENVSDNFNRVRITEQLRYGGVLEAVRVARSGFPVRLSHLDFYARYRSLASVFHESYSKLPAFISTKQHHERLKELCDILLQALWDETIPNTNDGDCSAPRSNNHRRNSKIEDLSLWRGKSHIARESVQMGLTKVFLRKPAHDVLESRRSRRLVSAARRIQSIYRCHRVHSRYVRIQWSVRLLQRVARGMVARSKARHILRERSVVKMQSHTRKWLKRWQFLRIRSAVTSLQLKMRGIKCASVVNALRSSLRATQLQRFIRGLLCRHRWRSFRGALVVLQSRWRKHVAKNQLKVLRAAAKDVGKLQQSNDALKLEIESLKARAAEETLRLRRDLERQLEEKSALAKVDELNQLRLELETALRQLAEERALRQQAEEATAAAEEEVSRGEMRLVAVRQTLSECEQSLSATEAKLQQTENALFNAAHLGVTNSFSEDADTSRKQRISSPVSRPTATSPSLAVHTSPPAIRGKSIGQPHSIMATVQVQQHHKNPGALSPSCPALSPLNGHQTFEAPGSGDEKYLEAIDALEKEAYARQVLEEEVSRLRQAAMEHKAQLDALRRAAAAGGGGPTNSLPSRKPEEGSALKRIFSTPSGGVESGRRTSLAAPSAPKIAEATPAQWTKAWDEEDSSSNGDAVVSPRSSISEGSSVATTAPLVAAASGSSGISHSTPVPNPSQYAAAVTTFEKNLDFFRNKLKQGVKAQFWEGQKTSNAEISLKLDPSNRLVVFEASQNKRAFALFQSRVDIAPISLSDIIECLPGAEIKTEASDQSLLLTIVTKTDQRGASRILALKFISRDVRNSILSGLRSLMADLQVNVASSKAQPASRGVPSSGSAVPNPMAVRRQSAGPTNAGEVPVAVNPMGQQRPARKLSVREIAQEEKMSSKPQMRRSVTQSQVDAEQLEESQRVANSMKRQLADEKEKHERMTIQILILTNDLNERDEQIASLKRKEEQFEQMLVDRDNMFKQDAMVRMQLGKRLEQVLMDKEEAYEQLELMKEQVESIKSSFASLK